jgi:hypothetical protein
MSIYCRGVNGCEGGKSDFYCKIINGCVGIAMCGILLGLLNGLVFFLLFRIMLWTVSEFL